MNLYQLYAECKERLRAAGIDAPESEAAALIGHYFHVDRPGLVIQGSRDVSEEELASFRQALAERTRRRPLQYILGTWPFMGFELAVGEGVLIPREDTEALVRAAAEQISGILNPAGVDLCAGTGAVSFGICRLVPSASITAVEYSETAFSYLLKNAQTYPSCHIRAVQGDITDSRFRSAGMFPPLDFIVSNPPYIETAELNGLQPEVRHEPAMALDGGPDGLRFYREILRLWLPLLKPGGIVGFEIGDSQARDVCALCEKGHLTSITVHQDLNGKNRCITAKKG